MQRSLLEAALDNDFILRDGMALMEAEFVKKKTRFKKKKSAGDPTPAAEPVKPVGSGHSVVDDPDFRSHVKTDAKPAAAAEEGVWERGKKWFKDTFGDGDSRSISERVHGKLKDIGNKVRDTKISGAATHGLSAVAGGVAGGHLMKKHLERKLWKYGPAAGAAALGAGFLAGRVSKDDN